MDKERDTHYVFEKAGTVPLWVLNQTPKNTMKPFFFSMLGLLRLWSAVTRAKKTANVPRQGRKINTGLNRGQNCTPFLKKMWCK